MRARNGWWRSCDDACGEVDETLAAQERGEAFAGVNAAAVQDGVEPHGAGGDALEGPRVELALEACDGAADAKP